jgi:hypothetical protein
MYSIIDFFFVGFWNQTRINLRSLNAKVSCACELLQILCGVPSSQRWLNVCVLVCSQMNSLVKKSYIMECSGAS